MARTRRPRGLHALNWPILLLFHVFCVSTGATHHFPQSASRRSVSSSSDANLQHHRYHQLQISRSCCFSTSPSLNLFRRSFIGPSNAAVQISASQPITATSLFFHLRRKKTRRSFLHSDGRSSISSHYTPAGSSYNCHFNGLSRQLFEQRGGGASTTAISAVVTTEESSASSNIDIQTDNNSVEKVGCSNNNIPEDDDDKEDEDTPHKFILIHSYNCTTTSLMGLGMPTRQFATWVRYYLSNSSSSRNNTSSSLATSKEATADEIEVIMKNVSTEEVHWENDWENHVMTLRQYWKDGTLLCEHTNLLNDQGGMSRVKQKKKGDMDQESEGAKNQMSSDAEESKDEEEQQMKYEHFRKILGSYADRLVNIVEDELSDSSFIPHDDDDEFANKTETISELISPRWTRLGLRGWIEDEYGVDSARALLASELLIKSEKEQLETFQLFLDWFRGKFPYFHDTCDACGASCKDAPLSELHDDENIDSTSGEIIGSNNAQEGLDTDEESRQHEDDEDNDDFSFVGYIGPSPDEQLGNASRTELYRCRSCSAFTRFPRYNKALWVTRTRRGRCGEYSMLLYRMLRSLGYDKIRWVVDWADHVWVEVLLGDNVGGKSATEGIGRWVHLDPCEAAVDNPLLYSSWGKNQTYLMAFYDPYASISSTADGKDSNTPPVEDVTLTYTNDEIDVITERRGIPAHSVAEAIKEVSYKMATMLKNVVTSS